MHGIFYVWSELGREQRELIKRNVKQICHEISYPTLTHQQQKN